MADWSRGQNRARINNLFNGVKPFTDDSENPVNVNFLEGTQLAHDARAQFSGAFLKPGRFFALSTDAGPIHKRPEYNEIVTTKMNRILKRSLPYFETMRSKFAMNVLHGIAPTSWEDGDQWAPQAVGIEDVGIPASTLLSMKNLPFFYVYRTFTVPELKKLIRNRAAAAAAGWNLPMADQCIDWVDKQCMQLMGSNYPTIWSPEKIAERIKGDGGFYTSDQVPTINCFDFYFWNDDDKVSGWNRRIVLDAWRTPPGPSAPSMDKSPTSDFKLLNQNAFLFDSGKRKYADKREQIIAFQFADLSSVAPFQYHSVRSLGFLTYAACHLQNRMRCRFSAAAFEASMNYFRVSSSDQVERAMKVQMINMGVIDETVQFVPAADRWQVDHEFLKMFLDENRGIIDRNTASYTAQSANTPGDRKTKFQVMAEMGAANSMVQAALNQAYKYQTGEYLEICRRFFKPNSTDPDVREFRAACLRLGVPDKVLSMECWDVEPERVMGAGNKTMEMAIAEQLMQMRQLYSPEAQQDILRRVTTAITDDPEWAKALVPENPLQVTDSIHDAQLAMGTLMQGLPVAIKTGMNHQEYVQVMLTELTQMVQATEQQGGMASPDKIQGYQMVAQCISQHLQQLELDPEQKQFVAQAQQALSKEMNLVRAFEQRLQEQMQKQQQQGQPDPVQQAKLQIEQQKGQIKMSAKEQEHAQKMAQQQLAFQQQQQREQEAFEADQHRQNVAAVHEHARKALEPSPAGSPS